MLAYLFWHRPQSGVDADAYEQAQRSFHASLEVPSACFRLDELPFPVGGEAADGYEDWYLVEDWSGIGDLNGAAVDAKRRESHDRAAALVGQGWGAVYASIAGSQEIPGQARWLERQPGEPIERLPPDVPVWCRQLVLGPAPELCVGVGGPARRRIGGSLKD